MSIVKKIITVRDASDGITVSSLDETRDWQEALLIHVAAQKKIQAPLRITVQPLEATQSQGIKIIFMLEDAAELNVVFDHSVELAGSLNIMVDTTLAPYAKLTFLDYCVAHQESVQLIHHKVEQKSYSTLNVYSLSLSAQQLRQELTVHLREAFARCHLSGVYLAGERDHIAHHVRVQHEAAHCVSTQLYKGIATDYAKVVFNGKVVVAKDAQKTHATQKNNNILLKSTAEVDTKPEFEIYANDVICSHGATVGEISDEALFYLLSRGISEVEAKKILLVAFVKEVLEMLPFSRAEVEPLLEKRLLDF